MRPPNDRDSEHLEDDVEEYNDDALTEFDELNASTATSTFLDNPWFRRIGIGFAILILIAFLLPVLAPFFSGSSRSDNDGSSDLVVLPDFLLPNANGNSVKLSDETRRNEAVVLVFYRGYF